MSKRSFQQRSPEIGERATSTLNPTLASGLAIAVAVLAEALKWVIAALLILLVRLYRLTLSPLLGPSCRFHPTCSAYAIEAIRHHGPLRGARCVLTRLGRCHPWSEGGFDPVR